MKKFVFSLLLMTSIAGCSAPVMPRKKMIREVMHAWKRAERSYRSGKNSVAVMRMDAAFAKNETAFLRELYTTAAVRDSLSGLMRPAKFHALIAGYAKYLLPARLDDSMVLSKYLTKVAPGYADGYLYLAEGYRMLKSTEKEEEAYREYVRLFRLQKPGKRLPERLSGKPVKD